MNWTHLAAFHAAAETGSFVRGAERLCVGQPAVSSHVADLETALKVTLFERLPRGVRLTEAGEVLLGYSRRLMALQSDAEQAIRELRGIARGRLRIGASTTVGAYLLPRLIGRFQKHFPGIEMTLEIGNAADVQRQLLDSALDFSVTEGFVEHASLSAEAVFHDQLVAIAPPGHPLVKMRQVKARALVETQVLLREPGSGTRAFIERTLENKRIRLKQTMSIGSTEAIKQAVIAGLGVAIVSRMTIERELTAGALTIIPLEDLNIQRPILLTILNDRPLNSAAKAFIPMLRKPGKLKA